MFASDACPFKFLTVEGRTSKKVVKLFRQLALLQLLDFMQGGGFDFGVEIIFSSHVARPSASRNWEAYPTEMVAVI